MRSRLLSACEPAPPGFRATPLHKRTWLEAPLAVFTREPALTLRAIAPYAQRVRGLLVVPAATVGQTQLHDRLWQLDCPEESLPLIAPLLLPRLELLAETSRLDEELIAGQRRLERSTFELQQLREDYQAVTARLTQQVQELVLAQQALREHQGLLDAVITSTLDSIGIRDRAGRYLLLNPAGAARLGHPVAACLGRTHEELRFSGAPVPPEATDEAIMAAGASVTYEASSGQRRRASWRVELITKLPFRDREGQILGVIAIARDITALKAAEHERLLLQGRAQRARAEAAAARHLNELKSAFINSISHELRTPLTSIRGYTEFLEDGVGGTLPAEQLHFVEQIRRGASRLEHLVDDLLDAARLEAGTFRLFKQRADLLTKIREIAASFEPQLAEARIRLTLELPPGPLLAPFDHQRIEQVLTNLVGNAIKFTASGGGITIRARREPEQLRCEVSDEGIGIAQKDLGKLFQRFQQLEAGIRMDGGTGLGLSISKALIEAHEGSIGVTSEPGQGSTFWFTLPLS